MDLDLSGTKTPSKLSQETFDELYSKLASLYSSIQSKMNSEILEKRMIMERITEAGMWLKMAYDMENAPDPQLVGEIKNVTRSDAPKQ